MAMVRFWSPRTICTASVRTATPRSFASESARWRSASRPPRAILSRFVCGWPGGCSRKSVRGKDPIDDARRGGALRHAGEVGGRGGLREREATLSLDLLEPGCAVFTGPGEHDADRAAAQLARKRQEQRVDREPATRGRRTWDEAERSAREEDLGVRGHHVHVVRHQGRPVLDLEHWHGGEPRERLREDARMVGRE